MPTLPHRAAPCTLLAAMPSHQIERTQFIKRPIQEVFGFFSRPENLEAITPPFLNFNIVTPSPIAMEEGALIDYRLQLYGLPVRWQARIERYEPEVRFVDNQIRGPYRRWYHLHEFRGTNTGTEMRDVVDYELPLGPLGSVAHGLFVRNTLERIFDYRFAKIDELLS